MNARHGPRPLTVLSLLVMVMALPGRPHVAALAPQASSPDVDPAAGAWTVQSDNQREPLIEVWHVEPRVGWYQIDAIGWAPGTGLDLRVLDPSGVLVFTASGIAEPLTGNPDDTRWSSEPPFPIEPGSLVTVRGNAIDPRERNHQILDISIDIPVNKCQTIVRGYGDPTVDSGEISVVIYGYGNAWSAETRATVQPDRTWVADFWDPGRVTDLKDVWEIQARQNWPDGNLTMAKWWPWAEPYFTVYPNDDVLEGFRWQVGNLVWASVDHPETSEKPDCHVADIAAYPEWDPDETFIRLGFGEGADCDIREHDEITVTDGVTVKQHTVLSLAVTNVDAGAKAVSGTTAYPTNALACWVDGEEGSFPATQDPSGPWICQFPESVAFSPGREGQAGHGDCDGDVTLVGWSVPAPYADVEMYLHGVGGPGNPATLYLDGTSPSDVSPKFKDSPGLSFRNGNPWKVVGVWNADPGILSGTLTSLEDMRLWLGLRNSDDVGTRLDLRTEVYRNGVLVTSGETYCIQGLARNPALAIEVPVTIQPLDPVSFDGSSDSLVLRVLVRIGTHGAGAFCGGHSSATGVRLYFDSAGRSSQFLANLQE